MAIPLRQQLRVGGYLVTERLRGHTRFPLVLELEPLFGCNLACPGCGKVRVAPDILRRRLSVGAALAAADECGAPVVSLAGGEPLLHPGIDRIAAGLVAQGRFVYLCTNGLLMARLLGRFRPSPRFAWAVHLDGLGDEHDASVARSGVFDTAVAAIRRARAAGFRVTTNSTIFSDQAPENVRRLLDYLNDELRVDAMMLAPAYAYEAAADQGRFLARAQTRALFRSVFADGRRRRWRLNHSPLYLDFLEGRAELDCSPWGVPGYSVLGWQRPCYLRADEHCRTWRQLSEETDWRRYGPGRGDARCDDCMAHAGYEPSAVLATTSSARASLRALRGVLT